MLHTLFEVSWEVCNKVGGIHTVISTKAKTIVSRYGDDYIAIGPWLMSYETGDLPFEESPGFEDFAEACRALGVPVRIGRWRIPGRPRTILVEFSGLYEKKDGILSGLWERDRVDSLPGGWDYVEPVLFGHACGMVIEKWWQENLEPFHGKAVAHFHEWMAASGMLYLKDRVPAIGTVFTTHATMLGRAVAATGQSPQDGLMGQDPAELAETVGVPSKHSLEGIAAQAADVFTTVSEITADEAQAFHQRRADPILPNGIDLDVIDEIAGDAGRDRARAAIQDLATRFLGEDVADAAWFAIAGRYEFHNKGIDLFLDALARINGRAGRSVVAFVLVPAGNSGLRSDVRERLGAPIDAIQGAAGISTHNLFDEDRDPVHVHCRKIGLENDPGARVKVLQIPIYLGPKDGLLDLPVEAVLRAMDLTCFPSFYEPWGYTPEESLAVGVPTITTDYAGFGRFIRSAGLGPEDGVHVLSRAGVDYREVARGLEDVFESFLGSEQDRSELAATCRETARRTAWSGLVQHYWNAYHLAREAAKKRTGRKTDLRSYRRQGRAASAPEGPAAGPRLVGFRVAAKLPPELAGLGRLARNYWWSWDHDAQRLYEELSPVRWEACRHNPIRLLRDVFPEDLQARAQDRRYRDRLDAVLARFDAYMADPGPAGAAPPTPSHPVAYFCAEFAIHESLKIHSGGLGVLAGDHLKSASDLGLPLVGVGLFYRCGYMRQHLTRDGDQVGDPEHNDPADLPLAPVLADGRPLELELQLPSRTLALRAWKVQVGRVPLYLLDTDVASNRPEDRRITRQLYGGDHENRLRQEIVLGRGGALLLHAIGLDPSVWHCNEGHAAFFSLERVRWLIRDRALTFDEAREVCRATTAFTTHTPVPAGHDRFGEDLMRRYFSDVAAWAGLPWDRFYRLGQAEGDEGSFNMTYLALNFASFTNGVSRLHGEVSQELLHPFWTRLLETEVPVTHVTNGVHLPTWTSPDLSRLLRDDHRPLRPSHFEERVAAVEPKALWEVKKRAKQRLLEKVQAALERSFHDRGDSPAVLSRMLDGLDARALLAGFARRFAPYKRAHLIFHDEPRLARILGEADRPMRLLIAGKAHPNDRHGQEILRDIARLARTEPFAGKVFFLEDYDLDLARVLVQGVDLWLNTPTRPLEASGTSGMKVACNGGLNLSVKDGWWVEAADGANGWSIGDGRVYDDQDLQDEMDATAIYGLLEDEILPLYFDEDDGVPLGWVDRVERSLLTLPPVFNTDRMVGEYAERAYRPLAAQSAAVARDRHALARSLAEKHGRIRKGFAALRVLETRVGDLDGLEIGDPVEVRVRVDLGPLDPSDVAVELVLGHTRDRGDLQKVVVVPLEPAAGARGTERGYAASYRMERCGSFAYGIRLRARAEAALDSGLEDLVLWA